MKIDSDHPYIFECYSNRAAAYFMLEEFDLAIKDYTNAIELDSTKVETYNDRGNVYRKLNNKVFMCLDYQKTCDLGNCELFNKHCK